MRLAGAGDTVTAPGVLRCLRAAEFLVAAVLVLLVFSGAPDVAYWGGFLALLMIQLVRFWLTDKSSKRGLNVAVNAGLIIAVIAKMLWKLRTG